MAIPAFLNSTFRFFSRAGMTDVATAITDLRAELVTSGGWSEPTTDVFKSPVDAAGRFFDVKVTRIAATNLEWRVRDQTATVICTRRAQIDGAGTDVEIFSSPFGVWVTFKRAARENLWAGMIDQSPIAQGASAVYTFGGGFRTTADVDDGQGNSIANYFMLDNGAAAHASRMQRVDQDSAGVNVTTFAWGDATLAVAPLTLRTQPAANSYWGGRVYHVWLVDAGQAFDSDVELPIDDGVKKVFRVFGLGTINGCRMAIRKGA